MIKLRFSAIQSRISVEDKKQCENYHVRPNFSNLVLKVE